jgi:hypothetical protein
MAGVVLRVRLAGGDHIDVTYDEPDTVETDEVIEHLNPGGGLRSASQQTW